ncbi:hypothetical protein HJG54_19215 [Leptolyngbya sp. NK1-12]|uniref:DUF4278 domain-containing protein n=1 Tax=Leptolyngbya sp. NK1-12 TaxID=2547451 RepID=A0AA96WN88_9CYAN|nr:hypothetical protein [Leptolyngbya sp. NK1-12]WNZ24761.1 hypothetical protein HJG54_19215 [Leptolyngbya sp. NK1-12]
MRITLRYRGVKYERDFYRPETGSEAMPTVLQLVSQPIQADLLTHTFVILRYRGVLYIRGIFKSEQTPEIRFMQIPAVISKSA